LRDENASASSRDDLDAWVRATWPRAVVFARSLLHRREAAEDVVQECYCSLLKKAGDYDLPRDGVRLLMTAVRHACLKRNVRERPVTSLSALRPSENGEARPLDPPDAGAAEPPRVVLHAELERAIADALAELPEEQRSAVELKGLGHSLQEIAAILGVTPSNAGVLIHRGRQALRQRLAPFLERQTG